MIKHVSKWFDLVPLSDHSNDGPTYAFLDVFNRFDAIINTHQPMYQIAWGILRIV
jgi:hypothetical protein